MSRSKAFVAVTVTGTIVSIAATPIIYYMFFKPKVSRLVAW